MFTRKKLQLPEIPGLRDLSDVEKLWREYRLTFARFFEGLNNPHIVEITPDQIKTTTTGPVVLVRETGTGDVEQATLGANLTLSGGVLDSSGGSSAAAVNSQSANYTTVAGDANDVLLHPSSDDNPRVFTIDSNANVPYDVGTEIEFQNRANHLQIKLTSDTLIVPGYGSVAGWSLPPNQMARARKTATTEWVLDAEPPRGTVLLMMNDNQANGSTVFNDQSIYARTITAVGNTAWSNANPPTGMTTHVHFDGVNDNLNLQPFDGWGFWLEDLTIEVMVYWAALVGSQIVFDGRPRTSGSDGIIIYSNGTSLRLFFNAADQITVAATLAATTWYHIAVTRKNGSWKMWKNGTQIGSTLSTNNAIVLPRDIFTGTDIISTSDFGGDMCCMRLTRGWARYDANFTPPTLPLSAAA